MPRPIYEIATDIYAAWPKVNPYAKPYLDAMRYINNIKDPYGADDGITVVAYFLANAAQFKGEQARALKEELKALLRSTGYKI